MAEAKKDTSKPAPKAASKDELDDDKDTRRVDTEAPNLDAPPLAASPANGGAPTPDPVRE